MGTGGQNFFPNVYRWLSCDPVETLTITSKQVQNLFYQYYKYEYYNDCLTCWISETAFERKFLDNFASCFYLNVTEHLIEWLCDLKADKIAGISNSVSKISYYTK